MNKQEAKQYKQQLEYLLDTVPADGSIRDEEIHKFLEDLLKKCNNKLNGIKDEIVLCTRPEDQTCGYIRPDGKSFLEIGCYDCQYLGE